MRQSHDQSSSLPTRFPVGAKYVVEGRGGDDGQLRVFSRYVLLPGGRRIKLPADLGQLPSQRSRRNRGSIGQRSRPKKIVGRGGAARPQRN
jgi:hypothetical protein